MGFGGVNGGLRIPQPIPPYAGKVLYETQIDREEQYLIGDPGERP